MSLAIVRWIAGPVLHAARQGPFALRESVRVGPQGLLGEVVRIHDDTLVVQVYEDTTGLSPGTEVRLRHVGIIKCEEVVKDAAGAVVELRCTIDMATRGGAAPGRKVKGTIHWLSAAHALLIEVRLYDRLFLKENPAEVAEGGHFIDNINPRALEVVRGAFVEPSMAGAAPGTRVQFERLAYFCVDPDSSPSLLVVNRTISLRDSWAKQESKA